MRREQMSPGNGRADLAHGEGTFRPYDRLLSASWRFGAALTAVLVAGFGGYAVITTDNELGSSTLLLIGVFFALVAFLGRVPRVRIGDNEMDPAFYVNVGGLVEETDHLQPYPPNTPPKADTRAPSHRPESEQTTMDKLLGAMTDLERMLYRLDPQGPPGRDAMQRAVERLAAVSAAERRSD